MSHLRIYGAKQDGASGAAYDASEIKRRFKVRFGDTPKPARETRALPKPETCSLHMRVKALAVFGDEAVDPRGDDVVDLH